ncbi:PAS domain S-box protein [Archangium gephyra]|uniref:DUF4118 domain-containing protein n=1 Tax=Archangium gephyra TaxID=48 RepID=UPI003B82036A
MAFLPSSLSQPLGLPPWARYGLALLLTGLAFSLQGLLSPWLSGSPYFLFLSAILLASWLGGHGPGVLATVLSLVLTSLFFRTPGPPSHHLVSSALFTGVSALLTLVASRVRLLLHEAHAARSAAQANGHTLAITLRSIGDAVLTTGPDGLVRFINPVASYFTGWREADAIGQPLPRVLRLVDPSTREPLEPSRFVPDEARPVQLGRQALLLSKSGAELPIEHTLAPISDSQGHSLGTVIVFRDISARYREEHEHAQLLARELDALREAETQRERLETLFMQAPVAICLTRGEDHVVELVNPLGQTLVGEAPHPGPLRPRVLLRPGSPPPPAPRRGLPQGHPLHRPRGPPPRRLLRLRPPRGEVLRPHLAALARPRRRNPRHHGPVRRGHRTGARPP